MTIATMNLHKRHYFCLVTFIALHVVESVGLWWTVGGPLLLEPRRICRKANALGGELQKDICKRDRTLVREIIKGVELGMDECQFQLRHHRWNCTTRRRSLGKMLLRDTRESAFVHATTASAVAHQVAQACGKGRLNLCSCRQTRRNKGTNGGGSEWLWEGCGDNIIYGYQKSSEFMDFGSGSFKDVRAKILHHNNEVGRQVIKSNMRTRCKCHGLSASCDLKTCFVKAPDFRETGNLLLAKFNEAKAVEPDNQGSSFLWTTDRQYNSHHVTEHSRRSRSMEDDDLVYTDASPNFCKRNRKLGVLGTKGRYCNASVTAHSSGSCQTLCCNRGHMSYTVQVEDNCRCQFKWCCEVQCEKCLVNLTVSKCR